MIMLITGATGAVGPRVVQAFHGAGYRVRTFTIHEPGAEMFPKDVQVFVGNIMDQKAIRSAMKGIDIVVHLAALLHDTYPSSTLRDRNELINVGGTARVVEESLQAGVKRVVFSSTIAIYGPTDDGQVLTEDSPPRPDTFYAQTKLAAEGIVLNAKRRDGQPLGMVLRLGAVYGSRVKGNYWRLLQSLARGRFIPIGDGLNRRTLIYDRDVARAFVLAAEHPTAAGRIYNVSDGQFHTLNEIIATICEALGRPPPRISLPVGPARLAAGILEDFARLVGYRSPVGRATVDKVTEDIAVSGQLIQAQLGFVPKFDLAVGWRETIQEMRQRGEL
jgi:UDP-glucose 4-epimerase